MTALEAGYDRQHDELTQQLCDAQRQLLASLLGMAWFVEARDPYTGGHLWRVARFARVLADRMGLPDAEAARISLGGFLHDLGKIGVPDAILRKPAALDEHEYALIRTHPELGLRVLAGHPLARLVRDAVGSHHERPDGLGYPHGLRAEQLTPMALIVGICDAFDAMTSHRPYRRGLPLEEALARIGAGAGRQFDAQLAHTLIGLGEAGELDGIIGHSDHGIALHECPMCAAPVAARRDHRAGQALVCRACCIELLPDGDELRASARPLPPHALQPELDGELIAATIQDNLAALPLAHWLARPGRQRSPASA